MLMLKTRVGPSPIHGVGVFACQDVAQGSLVWQFEPAFDRVIADAELAALPAAFKDMLEMYAYRSTEVEGGVVLPCDHARFLNHSDDPNTAELPFRSIARTAIKAGDEITCDYGAFCVGWTGFDP